MRARILAASAIVGDGGITVLNNADDLGVGDSTTAFSAARIGPTGGIDKKLRVGMDATYQGERSSNVLTLRSTFTTGRANYAWNKVGHLQRVDGSTMFSRKVEALWHQDIPRVLGICAATVTVAAA